MNLLSDRLHRAGAVAWEALPPAAVAVLRVLTSSLVRGLPSGAAVPDQAQRLDDLDADHVRLALSVHGDRLGEHVVVMLLAESQSAVTIDWDELLRHFDDVWLPSADDLLVIGGTGNYLLISHEEWCAGGHVERR